MEAYTKYEKARILGARALQLSMNAPFLLNIPKEKLEEISFDPLKIAEIEFNAGILPITVKRPFPKKEEIEKEEEEEEAAEVIEEAIKEEEVAPEEKKEEKEERKKIIKEETETEVEASEEEEEEETPVETEIE
jgi:DNA-directed RNA polymerase subunit K